MISKNYRSLLLLLIMAQLFVSCSNNNDLFIPLDIVIAHRGSTYHTPEETEAAYIWARNIGADYLEVDIQRSKDGVLLALHDMQLTRTTNIEEVYPNRKGLPAKSFTFEELMVLDAGTWFNIQNPERAQAAFSSQAAVYKASQSAFSFDDKGNKKNGPKAQTQVYFGGKQGISVLEDVIRIAEGYRIAKDSLGNRLYEKTEKDGKIEYRFFYIKDESDNKHRPGVYIETKEPQLFPNIEKDLFAELDRMNWNNTTLSTADTIIHKNGKVRIAKTSAKVILQTFSPESLKNLHQEFKGKVPVCFLLWLGDPNLLQNDSITYFQNLEFARINGAQIIGPSISGEPNNYDDLLTEENYRWIKSYGFLIHPYSFDTYGQTEVFGKRSDGMFTNRPEITLDYYQRDLH